MNILEPIILGIIQGITEFFPISSSGHLLIGMSLFKINEFSLLIEVALHIGTLIAILFYWKDDYYSELIKLKKGSYDTLFCIIIATIPAGVIGLFLKEEIESIFYDSNVLFNLMLAYLLMSIILYISKFYHENKKTKITYFYALLIGIAQSIAIIPGISRSGLTIIVALMLGITFKHALKFSFMLAIPILLFAGGSTLIDNFNLLVSRYDLIIFLLLGMFSSIISGYYIISILEKIVFKNKFWYFSFYCIMISFLLLIFNYG